MARYERTFQSRLAASSERVWKHAVTMSGVNAELRPLMQMTYPASVAPLDASAAPVGQPLFRSWLQLFGVIPIDWSQVTLIEVERGRRFLERSPMATMSLWQHERTIEPTADGCTLTDRLSFSPRFGGPLVAWFVGVLFRHRHNVLRRLFAQA